MATPIVALAAPALAFEAKALYLWHGLNAALIWSFWTWGAGVVLYLLRAPVWTVARGRSRPRGTPITVYYALLGGLEHVARAATRRNAKRDVCRAAPGAVAAGLRSSGWALPSLGWGRTCRRA